MKVFDSKTFNPEVFGQYVDTIPNERLNRLITSGAIKRDARLKALFAPQTGSYKGTLPIFGLLDGEPVNYDGQTDIPATNLDTYSQQFIVIGRAKGFKERDFSYDITGGVDFLTQIGRQISSYWVDIYQSGLLKVLNGIFSMTTGAGNTEFVSKHTYGGSTEEFGVTTLNNAIQKSSGDAKSGFTIAIMHSVTATRLENLQLLEFLKYTDQFGVTRDLTLATLNGRLVLIDDGMPVEQVYTLTTDVAIDPNKTYYTRSGSAGHYVYTPVANPQVADIGTYYELTATVYTTYVLGNGAITHEEVGAEVPYEVDRDPKTNGGETILYSRKRYIFAPNGISFVGNTATNSPTDDELENGANWSLVKNNNGNKFYPHKKITICRILTKASEVKG